jgi:hypothetical protein
MKSHNEEFHNLYTSHIISVIVSWRVGWSVMQYAWQR